MALETKELKAKSGGGLKYVNGASGTESEVDAANTTAATTPGESDYVTGFVSSAWRKVTLANLRAAILNGASLDHVGIENCHFSGVLQVTTAVNERIMQKSFYAAEDLTVTEIQVNGVDGLDPGASGDTVIRVSDAEHDGAGNGFSLTLANNTAKAVQTGSLSITGGTWFYSFITTAAGGHMGLDFRIKTVA